MARKTFEMTDKQLEKIMDASQAVPYLIMGGMPPMSPQENANRAWDALGKELGFKGKTARSISGKDAHHFTAEAEDE